MNTQIEKIVKISRNKSDVARALNLPLNGSGFKEVSTLIKDYDTSHFDSYHNHKTKIIYKKITKQCPVCLNDFITQQGHAKEKTTCSKKCSNTYFRSGEDNGNFKHGSGSTSKSSYRVLCFKYHKKECIVCMENVIVEVHHYDGDHKNNSPENLIPLCPTHHKYWHSRHRYLIKEKIDNYILEFKNEH